MLCSSWLRVPQLRGEEGVLDGVLRELDLERDVAVDHGPTANGQARLEGPRVEQGVVGLGLPEAGEDLGVQAVLVAGRWG